MFEKLGKNETIQALESYAGDLIREIFSSANGGARGDTKATWKTVKSGNSTILLEQDANGANVSRICTGSDGYRTVDNYGPDGQTTEITITDPSGANTTLRKVSSEDQKKMWEGQCRANSGRVLADAQWRDGFLYFSDPKSHSLKGAIEFRDPNDTLTPVSFTTGQFDPDRATFEYKNSLGKEVVHYIGSLREDIVDPANRSVVSGPTGQVDANGLTSVKHEDGSRVSMDQFNNIEFWDSAQGQVYKDKLSAAEIDYRKKHALTVDLRDLAEIHRRFHDNPRELRIFYDALGRFDFVPGFSKDRKTAIEAELMQQVAEPGEICQGLAGTCNVSQIEREMAFDQPTKLVSTVYDAVVKGVIAGASGEKFVLDRRNLMMDDTSERDLVSRIIQTAALQVAFDKKGVLFRNSFDGVGTEVNKDRKTQPFEGLSLLDIADLGYELTGETHSAVQIASADDLFNAFKAGSGRPIIASVEADMYPIVPKTTSDAAAAHQVTVTDVVPLAFGKYKVAFQNQWTLTDDHSTPRTMVDGDAFVKNLMTGTDDKDKREPAECGWVIVTGLGQGIEYKIQDGKPVPVLA